MGVYSVVTREGAAGGLLGDVRRTIEALADATGDEGELRDLAERLRPALERAHRIADGLDDEVKRARELATIARAEVRLGLIGPALATARAIRTHRDRWLAEIARDVVRHRPEALPDVLLLAAGELTPFRLAAVVAEAAPDAAVSIAEAVVDAVRTDAPPRPVAARRASGSAQ
jgi:hypothetical protein